MYKISQFSKLTGLTIKALRYYDEQDILTPSFRNKENQYRYYNDEDLKKARLIRYLRSLEFSIMEIREIAVTVGSEDDLTYILQEKIQLIEKNISKERALIQKISKNIPALEPPKTKNSYEIDKITVSGIYAAAIRFTGKYGDMDKYVPLLYKAVKNNRDGTHFNCYYDEECVENADIELCIPIKKQITAASVVCRHLPEIKALRITHHGSYDTLYLAYKAAFQYANAHNIDILKPTREVYIKSPGPIFRGNPANYITEILLPFEICTEKRNKSENNH